MKHFLVIFVLSLLMGPFKTVPDEYLPDENLVLAPRSRTDLKIPDELWDQVLDNTGHSEMPYGYTADEMSHFGIGSDCILPVIEGLFRDVRSVPQFSGRLGDAMLSDPSNFADSMFGAWKLLDAYSARQMSYAVPAGWGVDWIEEDASVDKVFEQILEMAVDSGVMHPIWDPDLVNWANTPDPMKKLIVRVLIAAIEAEPFLAESFDEDFYLDYFRTTDLDNISRDGLYEFATWPWQDEVEWPVARESYEALDRFDKKFFSTGSNEFCRMVWEAIEEYRLEIEENPISSDNFNNFDFYSPLGKVGVFGSDADNIEGDYSFIFDLDGSDNYTGSTAVPRSFSNPIGIVIDLGGNDVYDGGEEPASLACGNHGIGAIFDLDGNDEYICDESGIGAAWYGMGLVVDYEGDDSYVSKKFSEANAYAGVAMLIDLEGDDYYHTIEHGQGHAMTYGVGILVDTEGHDIYLAEPRGAPSDLYIGKTCNFAQGAAYGRRADFDDGHSLGGGIGALIDGGGDDSFTGSCYVQGASYWWAVGIIEDRGGNDEYFCEQYSIGSAPHFAIGCAVDLEGDDKYNIGNETTRQYHAHARDGSIGVFIDGSGNDEYYLTNLTAGSSDLNCLTLFWDRLGDDTYLAGRIPPRGEAFSFGDCRTYGP